MSDHVSKGTSDDAEDLACRLQTAEDEAEENLQNAVAESEKHTRALFQVAAGAVCRLAKSMSSQKNIYMGSIPSGSH